MQILYSRMQATLNHNIKSQTDARENRVVVLKQADLRRSCMAFYVLLVGVSLNVQRGN